MADLSFLRRPSIPLAASALCLATVGCEQPAPASAPLRLTVVARAVTRTDGARTLHLSGTLSAEKTMAVGFATYGTVTEVKVVEGQTVKKGEILARLATSSYEDALGIADAKLKQVEDAYRRLQPMYKNKTLPEVKMVEVETGRTQARLAVSMARKSLAETELRSPMAGIIASRRVEPGTTVVPGFPAFTLVQVETMLATAPVPELHVAKLRKGTIAQVTVPAIHVSMSGELREIAIAANPLTRTYDVKVALPNTEGRLRVGMIANIDLKLNGGEVGLLVPPEAVRVNESGVHHVFVVDRAGKLQRRRVKVATYLGGGIALSEGVREGELVVTSGTPMLSDGATVRLETEGAAQVRP